MREFHFRHKYLSDDQVVEIMGSERISNAERIDFTRIKMRENGVKAIANFLKSNSTLLKLELYNNAMGDQSIVHIAEAFKYNSTLTNLGLASNNIHQKGMMAIAEALLINTSIVILDLYDNVLENPEALAKVLKENNTLEALKLESNNIGDDEIIILSQGLKNNSTLKELNLASNRINDRGVIEFSEIFKSNSSLQRMNLMYNPLKDQGITAMRKGLEKNYSVVQFDFCISYSLIRTEVYMIHQIMEKNQQRINVVFKNMKLFYSLWKRNERICRVLYLLNFCCRH